MGDAIYQIRFASMTLQEFGLNVSRSGILTPKESVLFFEKFSGIEGPSEVWNLSEKRARERALSRCCRFDDYGVCWVEFGMCTWEHTICVSFSKSVNFHGVYLLGNEGEEYDVKLEVFSQLVEKKFLSQLDSRGIAGFEVMLPIPIQVKANDLVLLKATITGSDIVRYGSGGRKKVETNGMTVLFFNTPGVYSGVTTVEHGQFDEIIFSKIKHDI